jgi:hypothetical protein
VDPTPEYENALYRLSLPAVPSKTRPPASRNNASSHHLGLRLGRAAPDLSGRERGAAVLPTPPPRKFPHTVQANQGFLLVRRQHRKPNKQQTRKNNNDEN